MIIKTTGTIISNNEALIYERMTELGIYDHVQNNIPKNNAVMVVKADVFLWCDWSKSFLHIRTNTEAESKAVYQAIEERFLRAKPPARELMH